MSEGLVVQRTRTSNNVSARAIVDAAFVVVLGAIGILGFRTTYGGFAFLAVGIGALVLGVLISEASLRLRQAYLIDVGVALLAFFLLGGAIALRSQGAAGAVPSPGTLTVLAGVVVRGWKELLTIQPPVDDANGLLAIPYLVGLFGGIGGYGLARRTKMVALPALAPAVILVLSILFGTSEPAALLVQGSAFAALAVLWLSLRAARLRSEPTGTGAALKRIAMGLGVLVVAGAVAPVIGPRLPFASSRQRVVLSRYVVPPLTPNDLSSPLASFRDFTKGAPQSLASQSLFTVKGVVPGALVRIATMDSYNGLVWGFGTGTIGRGSGVSSSEFYRYGSVLPSSLAGRQGSVTVKVLDPVQAWLPTIGQPTAISFAGSDATTLSQDFLFDPVTGTAVDAAPSIAGATYTLKVTIPTTPTAAQLNSAAAGNAQLAVDVPTQLQIQASQWAANAGGAWAKVMKIAQTLKSEGRFSNGTETPPLASPGHSAGRLESFLSGGPLVGKQIVGDDEQFAATLALMANSLGVPARVVLGAQVPQGGVVKGVDVHAWVEVDLQGLGWVAVPPSSFLPTRPPIHAKPLNQKAQFLQTPIAPPVISILRPPSNALPSTNASSEQSLHGNKSGGIHVPGFVLLALKIVLPPVALVLAAAGLIGGLKARRRKRRKASGPAALRVAGGWSEIVDRARDLRYEVPGRATRQEQALILPLAGASALAGGADALVFGPGNPSDDQAAGFWRQVDAAVRELRSGVGRWRRIRALFNLTSLRRGGA